MTGAATAPRFPALPGYPELAAGLRTLGLRHAGELVWPDAIGRRGADGFRLLDGFRVKRAGHGADWWLVDRPLLAQERRRAAGRFPGQAQLAERLFDLVDAGMTGDVMALRHLVLYQVVTILGERGTIRDRHVMQLGVEEKEAATVAALAATTVRFDQAARDAAERLLDEVTAGRLRSASQLAAKIPDGHGDERLTRLCAAVRERVAAADALLTEAEQSAAAGDPVGAAESFRRAANHVPDDPRPRLGMIDAARRQRAGPDARAAFPSPIAVTEAETPPGVAVCCVAPRSVGNGTRLEYEFWRVPTTAGGVATRVAVVSDLASPMLDPGVDFGETVTYAVLPLRAGLVCGPAAVGNPYRRAPEIRAPHLVPTPLGVRARWRAPAGVQQIQVTRFGPGDRSEGVTVPCSVDGFEDLVSGFGECRYEVRCGYAEARGGGTVWSAGWTGSVQLAQWPAPVEIVRVELLETATAPSGNGAVLAGNGTGPVERGGGARQVQVSWRMAGAGADRMTVWPYTARERGDDISHLIDRLPQALADEPAPGSGREDGERPQPGAVRSAVVSVLPGRALRLTGVSLLGTRAVAGDSVLIFLPAPDSAGGASALRLRRVDAVSAEAVFAWPEPAALVRMVVERDCHAPLVWVLARSRARGQAVRFPLGRESAHVTAEPLIRPDAGPAFGETLAATLPALPPDPASRSALPALVSGAGMSPDAWNSWMNSSTSPQNTPYLPSGSVAARISWRALLRGSTWRAVLLSPLRILRRRRPRSPRP